MKLRHYLLEFFFVLLFLELLTINVYCNGIVVYPKENPIIRSLFMFIIFGLGTVLEYLILKKAENIARSEHNGLIRSFFKVNLVTFPLTQILAYIVFIYFFLFFWIYILIIEILVVLIEWVLLKTELNRAYNIHIESKKFLLQVGLANFGSFLLGLLLFIPTSY